MMNIDSGEFRRLTEEECGMDQDHLSQFLERHNEILVRLEQMTEAQKDRGGVHPKDHRSELGRLRDQYLRKKDQKEAQ